MPRYAVILALSLIPIVGHAAEFKTAKDDIRTRVEEVIATVPDDAPLAAYVEAVKELEHPTAAQERWNFWLWYVRAALAAAAIALALWSASVAIGARSPQDKAPTLTCSLAIVFLLWSVGPPVWFWLEYAYLWPQTGTSFEDLKYGQELAKNIWVSIGAVLITLYARG
jgi:hypothetical protein